MTLNVKAKKQGDLKHLHSTVLVYSSNFDQNVEEITYKQRV